MRLATAKRSNPYILPEADSFQGQRGLDMCQWRDATESSRSFARLICSSFALSKLSMHYYTTTMIVEPLTARTSVRRFFFFAEADLAPR